MKREQLEKLLLETAEEEPRVSGRLNQDVMRAVKLVTISQHSLIPEKDFKAELERLKSDLKRFNFRA